MERFIRDTGSERGSVGTVHRIDRYTFMGRGRQVGGIYILNPDDIVPGACAFGNGLIEFVLHISGTCAKTKRGENNHCTS